MTAKVTVDYLSKTGRRIMVMLQGAGHPRTPAPETDAAARNAMFGKRSMNAGYLLLSADEYLRR